MKLYVKLLFLVGGWWVGGWWVLDFTRLMLISTQVEVVVELKLELSLAILKRSSLSEKVSIMYVQYITDNFVSIIIIRKSIFFQKSTLFIKHIHFSNVSAKT